MAEHELNKIVDDDGEVFNLRDSTKQPVADRVTAWGSTPSDTKYPSEKLVKDALDGKATSTHTHGNIQNGGTLQTTDVTIASGDKLVVTDASDSNKVARTSVSFDGSTTKNFLSKKGTFEEVKESEVAWGGDFHADLSPIEMGMFPQNLIANPPPENIKYEQTTDGGETWSVVSLTDSQKKQFCNLTSGVTLPAGPTTTDDNVLPLQRGRVTIALLPFGATEYSDTWCYGQVKRILLYINRSSSPEVAHCVVEVQTGPHFIANDGVWTTLGDYNVTGDGGWNSIPIGDILGGYSSQLSGRRVAIRFTYWVTKKPTSGSGGRISLYSLGILPGTVWKSNANAVAKQKLPVQVENDGTGTVQKSMSLVTARKLKTNLARTADSTFDGSADQTNIPVTGTLPVGNGGTGKASVTANSYLKGNGTGALVERTYAEVRTDLGLGSVYSKDVPTSGNASTTQVVMGNDTRLSDARTPTAHTHTADAADVVDQQGDSAITDSTDIITTHVNGYSSTNKKLYKRNFKDYVWPWIKDKISSVLGLSTTGYTGNAATATKATQDSDGNAINATYFKSSGNTTLVAGAATKIGTQNGADVKLTLPAHQDISGKMNTSASNAASGALQNLTAQLTEGTSDFTDSTEMFTSYAGNSGFAESGHVNQPYRRKASSMLNYIESKRFYTRNPADVGTGTKRIQLGYALKTGVGYCNYIVHVFFNSVAGSLTGCGVTLLVNYDWNTTSQKAKCVILNDNGLRAAGYNIVLANFLSNDGTNQWMHITLGLVNNSAPGTLVAFTYSYCGIFRVNSDVNWVPSIASDTVGSYDQLVQAVLTDADTVDGYHIQFGSYSSRSDTISFY